MRGRDPTGAPARVSSASPASRARRRASRRGRTRSDRAGQLEQPAARSAAAPATTNRPPASSTSRCARSSSRSIVESMNADVREVGDDEAAAARRRDLVDELAQARARPRGPARRPSSSTTTPSRGPGTRSQAGFGVRGAVLGPIDAAAELLAGCPWRGGYDGPDDMDQRPVSTARRRRARPGRTHLAGRRCATGPSDCDIRLTLPARAENVALVRHVVGALAEALAASRRRWSRTSSSPSRRRARTSSATPTRARRAARGPRRAGRRSA